MKTLKLFGLFLAIIGAATIVDFSPAHACQTQNVQDMEVMTLQGSVLTVFPNGWEIEIPGCKDEYLAGVFIETDHQTDPSLCPVGQILSVRGQVLMDVVLMLVADSYRCLN